MTDDDAKNLQALTKEQQVQYLQREIEALRKRPLIRRLRHSKKPSTKLIIS